jgi:hypothetical protein
MPLPHTFKTVTLLTARTTLPLLLLSERPAHRSSRPACAVLHFLCGAPGVVVPVRSPTYTHPLSITNALASAPAHSHSHSPGMCTGNSHRSRLEASRSSGQHHTSLLLARGDMGHRILHASSCVYKMVDKGWYFRQAAHQQALM